MNLAETKKCGQCGQDFENPPENEDVCPKCLWENIEGAKEAVLDALGEEEEHLFLLYVEAQDALSKFQSAKADSLSEMIGGVMG